MNATTWLSLNDDEKTPILTKVAPKNNNPIKEPQNPPTSIFPWGRPKYQTEIK